jgi:CBS domain-containing membrane protein
MRRKEVRSASILRGILARLHLRSMERRWGTRRTLAVFGFVNGTLSIGLLAVVAHFFSSAFVFPSLGPTAFLLFYRPLAAASSPRNAVLGHLIGALAGWASLALFGLLDAPPVTDGDVSWPRVGAAALSLGATSGLMIGLRAAHPPAGATTLIVSLGLMPHAWQIPVLMAAVMLLIGQALVVNRLASIPYPLWRSSAPQEE